MPNMGTIVLYFNFIFFSVLSLSSHASDATATAFPVKEIADGLYVHQGVHVAFEHERHDDIANLGFIIGDKCIAVIDTGGSVRVAKQLKQAIRSVSDKPICYVINTHVHFDHVLGNIVFKDAHSQFVGHAKLAPLIEANREFFVNEFKADLAEYATGENIIGPGLLVEDTLELDLGNRPLTLTAHPTAHSDADLTVYDSKTNSLWLSDLLFVERIPVLDGSLKGWLKIMEEVEKKQYRYIIPGHGSVGESLEILSGQKQYLELLLNEIRKKIAVGAFMEEIVEEVGKEEKRNWLLHEQHHKRNVTKAFSELEWE